MSNTAKHLVMIIPHVIGCLSCGRKWDADMDDAPQPDSPCPSEDCPSHDGKDGLTVAQEAATEHGNNSIGDHEIGDLQDMLNEMWELLTPQQKALFVGSATVRELIKNELAEEYVAPEDEAELPVDSTYLVIQEGGSSTELYVHDHRTEADAIDYRKSCEEAAYRTSAPIKVHGNLASHPDFFTTVASILDATQELDYPGAQ